MIVRESVERQPLCKIAPPDDLTLKTVSAKNLIEHDFHIVAGVPITVIIETSRLLKYAREFDAARTHVVYVGLSTRVTILEGALLLRLTPKNFVVPVRVERRIDVDEMR